MGAPTLRPWGYVTTVGACGLALTWLARRWRVPPPAVPAVAERVERLFPQARGRARDVVAAASSSLPDISDPPAGGLAAARAADARAWVAVQGARLDRALSSLDTSAGRRARRGAAAALLLLALAALVEPGASRRVVGALAAPARLWSAGMWAVEPGEARVAHGAGVHGTARFEGPPAAGPLVVEWEGGGLRGVDTLGPGPVGSWRWSGLTADRRYRLRWGAYRSPHYRIAVGAPLALGRIEARRPDGSWEPLAGAIVTAGQPVEIRGRASAPLAAAAVVPAGRGAGQSLAVAGASLHGIVQPAAGAWRLEARAEDGRIAPGPAFHAVPAGAAYVLVLEPRDDPARLEAASAWIEARTGGPRGIAAVGWETADGRSGELAAAGGARDTVVTGLAPLAEGRAPGDAVRYRLVARSLDGGVVLGAWRTAVLADEAHFRARAEEARDRAARDVQRAAAEARDAAERSPTDAAQADERLRGTADSLAAALDQALSDPRLEEGERERLMALRDLLRGAADAELARSPGAAPDPAAAARARADLVERIADAVRRAEEFAARDAAADSLSILAEAERALARATRERGVDGLAESMREQAPIAAAAQAAAERLGADAARDVEQALDHAARALAAGDPSAAAGAQEAAAGAMEEAAGEARARSEADAARAAARRRAIDRAAGETLFLAERQRAVADGERGVAERLARQRVVVQGTDRMVEALVEGLGGTPAAAETGRLLAESVYRTRRAETALAGGASAPGGERLARAAAEQAAQALALLARALLVPPGGPQMAGAQGGAGDAGTLARQLDAMASAQRAIADAAARADDPAGGNPEAAAAERRLGEDLGGLAQGLAALGVEPRAVEALAEAVESAARRLERGLPGGEAETELRSLARRFADLGRIVQRTEGERRAEAARPFVPAEPPPLPARATARRLDPEAALAPWTPTLPRSAEGPARAYLERLAEEGVRAP